MKKLLRLISILLVFLMVLAACSSNTNTTAEPEDETNNQGTEQIEETGEEQEETEEEPKEITIDEPVTLKVFFPFGKEIFEQRMKPIEERLENITLELVTEDAIPQSSHNQVIEELIAKDNMPDLFLLEQIDLMDDYIQEFIHPLDELVERHNFDLSIINPSLIQTIRSLDTENRLISFPNSNDLIILYYNKVIFDKFGVDYPTEKMTWEEVIELAERLTGERDGVQYIGLDIRDNIYFPLRQRAVNLTDPDTGEVLFVDDPAVKEYFELIERIYKIPQEVPETHSVYQVLSNVAMTISSPQFMRWGIQWHENSGDVDISYPPVWSSNPNVTEPAKSTYHWVINKYSEHKDAAFKVLIEYTSDESQEMLVRKAEEMTILADDSVKAQFGAELEIFEGKNIESMYAIPANDPPERISRWDQFVDLKVYDFIFSDKDINQHLREVAEETEIKIKEYKETQ